MQNSTPAGVELAQMSGVRLVRYGPFGEYETRYEVIEPDHVASFSHLGFEHPLEAAVAFLLNRVNARFCLGAPFPHLFPE